MKAIISIIVASLILVGCAGKPGNKIIDKSGLEVTDVSMSHGTILWSANATTATGPATSDIFGLKPVMTTQTETVNNVEIKTEKVDPSGRMQMIGQSSNGVMPSSIGLRMDASGVIEVIGRSGADITAVATRNPDTGSITSLTFTASNSSVQAEFTKTVMAHVETFKNASANERDAIIKSLEVQSRSVDVAGQAASAALTLLKGVP